MTNKSNLLAAGIILLAGCAAYWLWQPNQRGSSPSMTNLVSRTRPSGSFNPEMARQIQAVAAGQKQWDQTIWAKELTAQRHEDVFIKLWDELRNQEDAYGVLEQFPFDVLRLATNGVPEVIEHNITARHLTEPYRHLAPATWRQWLTQQQSNGFRLEQSEWRHAKFELATNGAASSTIDMTLHAWNTNQNERFIVRGKLRVQWRRQPIPQTSLSPGSLSPPADDEPFPEVIEAADLEVLSRPGAAPFHHVVAADILPEKPASTYLEPSLILYDLDGDGLSEIILPGCNRVYWNKGQGKFSREPLLVPPLAGLQSGLIADFDGDGLADYLAADNQGLMLYKGAATGHFPNPGKRVWRAKQSLPNPIVMTAGDIDQDGDLDIWLAQYKVPYQGGQMPTPFYDANDGYPSFLLVNDGRGFFVDRTEEAGLALKRFRRTYSCSFIDLDDNGSLDLLVVSDFSGPAIYLNDGHGHFTDATPAWLDETHAFGMSHRFGDFNLDGQLDLLVIGMNSFAAQRLDEMNLSLPGFELFQKKRSLMSYGNRLYLRMGAGFKQTPLSDQVARSGWSWGVTTGDFDNDGTEDIYIVNGHISGPSAKDYDSYYWRHDIYMGTSRDDPVLDAYFRSLQTEHRRAGESYGGYEKNRFYLNRSGKSFLEVGYLMGVAMEEDCRNVVSDDLDGDGQLDLLVTTFKTWPRVQQQLHLFPNFTPVTNNWIGVRLRESRPGFSPVGTKVILTAPTRQQIRVLLTGDSYRSQHANTAHFGLGTETQVKSLEVVWPNGQKRTVLDPAINRYHLIMPEPKK